jgi:hypothetical protein
MEEIVFRKFKLKSPFGRRLAAFSASGPGVPGVPFAILKYFGVS